MTVNNYIEQLKRELPDTDINTLLEFGFIDEIRVRNFLLKLEFNRAMEAGNQYREDVYYMLAGAFNLSQYTVRNIIMCM